MGMDKSLVDIIKFLSRPVQPDKTDIPPSLSCSSFRSSDIKAVMFDLYGTLMVSAAGDISTTVRNSRGNSNFRQGPGHHGAPFTSALETAGIAAAGKTADEDSLQTLFFSLISMEHENLKKTGNPSPEVNIIKIWETLLKDAGFETADTEKIQIASAAYEAIVNKTWPMPGLSETLENLRKAGLAMGIISNAQFYSKLLFDAYLEKSAAESGFEPQLCFWSYEHGISKPDPFLFKKAAEVLNKEKNIPLSAVVFIGNDMLNDIKPAAEAGMKTILFAGDRKSLRLRDGDEIVKGIIPDFIITELCQILDILDLNS